MYTNTIFYLEMLNPEELVSRDESHGMTLVESEVRNFHFNRFLYELVGRAWHWTDKLKLTDQEWQTYVTNPQMRTWVAYYREAIAGYFELCQGEQGDVEIVYFGLVEDFIGQGFGGYLLSQAIEKAWSYPNVTRVWVHTCSLDHPHALDNYRARGFKLYKQELVKQQPA